MLDEKTFSYKTLCLEDAANNQALQFTTKARIDIGRATIVAIQVVLVEVII